MKLFICLLTSSVLAFLVQTTEKILSTTPSLFLFAAMAITAVLLFVSILNHQKHEARKTAKVKSNNNWLRPYFPFIVCLVIVLLFSTNSFAGIGVNTVHDSNTASRVFWNGCVQLGYAICKFEMWLLGVN